jgi:hypothetical protein
MDDLVLATWQTLMSPPGQYALLKDPRLEREFVDIPWPLDRLLMIECIADNRHNKRGPDGKLLGVVVKFTPAEQALLGKTQTTSFVTVGKRRRGSEVYPHVMRSYPLLSRDEIQALMTLVLQDRH